MKTLDQVEARIPINATTAPDDNDSLFWITKPGSYYLTDNITGVSGKNGIKVGATDVAIAVTIDLNGFSMTGVPGSNIGIVVLGSPLVTVRNGFVKNWGGSGIFLADRSQVDGITAESNGGKGIEVGGSSVVSNCIVASNGDTGLNTGNDAIVRSVVCRSNQTGASIGIGSVVSHSTFRGNQQTGLGVGSGSTVQNCAADVNSLNGIFAGTEVTIVDCTATNNLGYGIVAAK